MVQIVLAAICLLGGIFFLVVSCTGLLRLPDFYARCHAIGKSETLGAMLVLLGLAIFNGFDVNSFKLIVILVFIALANPTATHIIARAAYRCGLQPWVLSKRRRLNNSDQIESRASTGDNTIQDRNI